MKSLIAVVNARSRQGTWANAVRSTWFNQVPKDKADIKFFVGRGEGSVPLDTVTLDCDDTYDGLPEKVREIVRYAQDNDYEHVMKLDDDVVVKPHALLDSGYEHFPYSGRANRKPTISDPFWVPMGFAYWMNRDCMKAVSNADLPIRNDDERWVAENLHKIGIELQDEKRYHLFTGGLIDRPIRLNRPLRVGKVAQDESAMSNGFAWCMFFEPGGVQFNVPIETKIKEFHRIFQKFGEPVM